MGGEPARRRDPEAALDLFWRELEATDHTLAHLLVEYEEKARTREAELKAAQAQLQQAQSEQMALAMDLEARVGQRTLEIQALNGELERRVKDRTTQLESANRAKSAFLANMSHEIRTLLNAILGFSQLLLRSGPLPRRQMEFVDGINRAGEHLLTQINAVLDLFKIESGRLGVELSPLDLRRFFADLDHLFRLPAEARGLAFRMELGDLPEFAQVDEAKVSQILVNLLGNALKFTDQGWITLRAGIRPGAAGEAGMVVEVEDTGSGIPPEDEARLFAPFEQGAAGAAKGGTGLGLAISRQFARLLGGDLTLERPGPPGCLFRLALPLQVCDGQATFPLQRVAGLQEGQESVRILVVDDRDTNRQVLVEMLKLVGFEAEEARDGAGALACFHAWKPHAVLLDIRMPGMSGLEVLSAIKGTERGRRTPVIAVTASAFLENRQEALDAGADDFISKPFRETEVFEKLRLHLGLRYRFEAARASGNDPALAASDLRGCPADLLQALRRAVRVADYGSILDTIGRIEKVDARVGQGLRRHARAYDYQNLLDLLPSEAPS